MMQYIALTQGQYTIVDDDDFQWLNQFKWCASFNKKYRGGGKFTATRQQRQENGKQKTLLMHRVIMGIDNPKMQVDHIDGNTLNNQRANLRPCTPQENTYNIGKLSNNTSGFKGVNWNKTYSKYQVHISIEGKSTSLGYFTDVIEAALAYDQAARQYHGPFANTNFEEGVVL